MTDQCYICGQGSYSYTKIMNFDLCKWCSLNVEHFIKSKSRNILWASGRISRGCWLHIKSVLKEYDIKSVLEFGSGLSTELFSLENIELHSYDILKNHIELMRKALPSVTFVNYEFGRIPKIEREFDMVFVDSPTGDRSNELRVANDVARKVIFCHDWGRKQDTVKLDDRWQMKSLNKVFVSS